MPVIANVGEIVDTYDGEEVGTRGCDPCVGLVVIYENGTKKCAHFCVSYAGPYTQANINARLNPILLANFPNVEITSVGFTWGGNTPGQGAELICNRLLEYFHNNVAVTSNTNDSIISNGDGVQISNLQVWPFTNDPASNQFADLA
ncbi:MAG: hypothetical protein JST82_04220 [Bacteroidetes bacterium]|nr:hypothetical protein [Bacteroidota bacterium]